MDNIWIIMTLHSSNQIYLYRKSIFFIFSVCLCCTPYVNYSESKVGLGPLLKYLISLECMPPNTGHDDIEKYSL